MNQKIDRKAFEEYEEHNRQSTVQLYRIVIAVLIVINAIFGAFYVTFKIKTNSVANNNIEIKRELDTIRNTKTPQDAKTEKMLINIFGQLDLQFNLLTEILTNVTVQ